MAIECTVTSSIGIEVPAAYIRIDTLQGHKSEMRITANAYLSQTAWESGSGYVAQFSHSFIPDTELALWPQAYASLKSLGQFEDAVDV